MPTTHTLPKGWYIDYQPSAISSNDLALAALRQSVGKAEGKCFQVGEQTKGRGRRGKQWVSKSGDGLYLSIILCPETSSDTWSGLSFVASLAVYKAVLEFIEDAHILRFSLKWPNDILYDNRKLAGILLEVLLAFSSRAERGFCVWTFNCSIDFYSYLVAFSRLGVTKYIR